MKLSWFENGNPRSLIVPSSKNLTQNIILESFTKPDPLVFSAMDMTGKTVLINLAENVTVEFGKYASDVTLDLAAGMLSTLFSMRMYLHLKHLCLPIKDYTLVLPFFLQKALNVSKTQPLLHCGIFGKNCGIYISSQ